MENAKHDNLVALDHVGDSAVTVLKDASDLPVVNMRPGITYWKHHLIRAGTSLNKHAQAPVRATLGPIHVQLCPPTGRVHIAISRASVLPLDSTSFVPVFDSILYGHDDSSS